MREGKVMVLSRQRRQTAKFRKNSPPCVTMSQEFAIFCSVAIPLAIAGGVYQMGKAISQVNRMLWLSREWHEPDAERQEVPEGLSIHGLERNGLEREGLERTDSKTAEMPKRQTLMQNEAISAVAIEESTGT